MEQRGIVGLWKMKHLHLGPGNEGVFLRDDSEEEDQRAMEGGGEVKQRECIRSGGGDHTTDPRLAFWL